MKKLILIFLGVDADKFIDADDGSEKDQPADDGKSKMDQIAGEDTTGRNKAADVYPKIETSIISYYAILDNPEDQELFYDYLVANLKLYFDKWENEVAKMSKSLQTPRMIRLQISPHKNTEPNTGRAIPGRIYFLKKQTSCDTLGRKVGKTA